jgi:hypothetical protein
MSTNATPSASRWLVGAILLIAIVTLSGCMHVDRTLLLYGDGTGSYTLTIGFREPTPNQPSSTPQNTVSTMEAFGARVQQTGGSYRRYEDQGYDYWTYTRPFTTVETANAFLQEDPREYDPAKSPVLYHDALHLALERGLFTTRLHLNGQISLVDLTGKATNWTESTETVTVTMPDGIASSQGGTRHGNSISYSIGYNQSANVDVVGDSTLAPSAVSPLLISMLALALAAVSVVLTVVGFRVLRGAAKQKPQG